MPKHGEQRNYRMEHSYKTVEFQGPGRMVVEVTYADRSQSVSERWCDWCQEWIEARGVLGGFICPGCGRTWHEDPKRPETVVDERCWCGRPMTWIKGQGWRCPDHPEEWSR